MLLFPNYNRITHIQYLSVVNVLKMGSLYLLNQVICQLQVSTIFDELNPDGNARCVTNSTLQKLNANTTDHYTAQNTGKIESCFFLK